MFLEFAASDQFTVCVSYGSEDGGFPSARERWDFADFEKVASLTFSRKVKFNDKIAVALAVVGY